MNISKKYLLLLTCIVISVFALTAVNNHNKLLATTTPVPVGTIGQSYDWSNLIFEDNFNGTSVDSSKWARCIYWGITSKGCYENLTQLEWYMPANGTTANGIFTLQAKKERIKTPKGTFNYTSGFIDTDRDTNTTTIPAKFDFQYGYVEMRAKVPAGKGLWPAFWMLPSDHTDSNEIDIMEILGDHPEKTYMTYHYGNSQSVGGSWNLSGTDFSKDYHVYAVDWNESAITWYIDGTKVYEITDTSILPTKPFYLIANLQIGGAWAGNPDSSTVFPANYSIDYIRVWKKGAALPTTPTPTPTPVSVNLIQNPSFENGTTPWSLDVKTGAAATFALDNTTATDGATSAVINTTQSSSTDWYVQFTQSNLSLQANKQYVIEFIAKADSARQVPVIIQMNNSPYTELTNQTISLTTNWTKYTLYFIPSVAESNAKFSMSLGANTGRVWVDNVVVGY